MDMKKVQHGTLANNAKTWAEQFERYGEFTACGIMHRVARILKDEGPSLSTYIAVKNFTTSANIEICQPSVQKEFASFVDLAWFVATKWQREEETVC